MQIFAKFPRFFDATRKFDRLQLFSRQVNHISPWSLWFFAIKLAMYLLHKYNLTYVSEVFSVGMWSSLESF